VKMFEGKKSEDRNQESENFAVVWFENRLNEARAEVGSLMNQFRLSEALKTIYSLIWDDFCSWYLEWIKPGFEQSMNEDVYNKTVYFLEELIQLLHPYMPFITEEIYHLLKGRKDGDDLCMKQFEGIKQSDKMILQQGLLLKEFITKIRNVRVKSEVKNKDEILVHIISSDYFDVHGNVINPNFPKYSTWNEILRKQINGTIQYNAIPVGSGNIINETVQIFQCQIELRKEINTSGQVNSINKEIEYFKNFLASVEKKLNNTKFTEKAKKEVIDLEHKKRLDALKKIEALQESLTSIEVGKFFSRENNSSIEPE
jgi:valyl-tRNA synthetase